MLRKCRFGLLSGGRGVLCQWSSNVNIHLLARPNAIFSDGKTIDHLQDASVHALRCLPGQRNFRDDVWLESNERQGGGDFLVGPQESDCLLILPDLPRLVLINIRPNIKRPNVAKEDERLNENPCWSIFTQMDLELHHLTIRRSPYSETLQISCRLVC